MFTALVVYATCELYLRCKRSFKEVECAFVSIALRYPINNHSAWKHFFVTCANDSRDEDRKRKRVGLL